MCIHICPPLFDSLEMYVYSWCKVYNNSQFTIIYRHILFQLSKSLDPSLKQPHEKIALFRGFSSNGILKSANNPDQMKVEKIL